MCRSIVTDGSPDSARAMGLGEKFRYWRGASGRRYLFSSLPQDAVDDIVDAVVIMTAESAHGSPRIVWAGEIDGDGVRSGRLVADPAGQRLRWHAHFLAPDAAARAVVLADLLQG